MSVGYLLNFSTPFPIGVVLLHQGGQSSNGQGSSVVFTMNLTDVMITKIVEEFPQLEYKQINEVAVEPRQTELR